jgi:type I restriction enzyme S subunit
MSFPRYPEYKDSGVEWLGEIPTHWGTISGRRLFNQKRDPVQDGDEQLSATQKYGVIPQSRYMELEDQKVTLALSGLDNFKHVEVNDFVISLRSFQGGIEHCSYRGCVSPAYTVLRSTKEIYYNYWKYLMKCSEFVATLQSGTDSIREGKSISFEQFGRIELPFPEIKEQSSIARYLDLETGKVDVLIAEQEKLIELLKEKGKAIIAHAVTKGLDPTVSMKESGIEWLGKVPEHWRVVPLRWFSRCSSGLGIASENIEDYPDNENTTPVIGGNGIMGYTNFQNIYTPVLVIGRVGALCGNVHLVNSPAWITDNALVLNASQECFNLSYLKEVLESRNLNDISSKTAQPLITGTQVLDQRVPCPPVNEQIEIISYLEGENNYINDLISEAQRAIELLKERRSSLISAAVTGKIDVRGLVPQEAIQEVTV